MMVKNEVVVIIKLDDDLKGKIVEWVKEEFISKQVIKEAIRKACGFNLLYDPDIDGNTYKSQLRKNHVEILKSFEKELGLEE